MTTLANWVRARRARRHDRILAALRAAGGPMTGLDIARAARIRSGATYIALTRLVRYGAVTSRWVQVDPWSGALQRRMYELAKEES